MDQDTRNDVIAGPRLEVIEAVVVNPEDLKAMQTRGCWKLRSDLVTSTNESSVSKWHRWLHREL